MTSNSGTIASRFLALPAELRTRIYDFVFLDNAASKEEIDIYDTLLLFPQATITLVNRQIRSECYQSWRTAREQFWLYHKVVIKFNFRFRRPKDGELKAQIIFMCTLLRWSPVKHMVLRIEPHWSSLLNEIRIDINIDQAGQPKVSRQLKGLARRFNLQTLHDIDILRWKAWVYGVFQSQQNLFASQRYPGSLDAYLVGDAVCEALLSG